MATRRSFLKHGYRIYIVTNLPEQEFADRICDFALYNVICHKNILFRKSDDRGNPVEQLKLTLFFSASESEVRALNEGTPRPVACHLLYAQPANQPSPTTETYYLPCCTTCCIP